MADDWLFPPEENGGPIDPAAMGRQLRQDLADYFDDLLHYRMPFGRFRDSPIDQLPYEYLSWFDQHGGFPRGRLGELMEFVYHTKAVGAETVFARLREMRASGYGLK